ncbi:cyclase family protein [Pyxidicoccus sp. MSG2]|uniref:cyclase family protein n=1 Tax=Pyxidicoccus sp. MSG2 TaxID=2996790 RepID=UPI002271C53D|nr:cyclase family protein [Pyxidicoccus sp. MSG2]MCY1018148.1 cyclase family protein [Pyxidicoccus sp. MSG2]
MKNGYWKLLLLPLPLLSGACATSGAGGHEAQSPAAWLSRARVIDLGHPITPEMPLFPGGTRFNARVLGTVERDGYYIRQLELGEHGGTHVDAPAHFAAGTASVDQLPVEMLSGPAAVLDVTAQVAGNPDYAVSPTDIEAWERAHGPLQPQHLVLIRTGWASRWPDEQRYRNADAAGVLHFPGLSVAASQVLRQRKVRAIGIDTLSTDPGPNASFEQHKDFLPGGGYHIENLADLSALPPVGAFLVVSPLSVKDGSGAPARVFAFLPPEGGATDSSR